MPDQHASALHPRLVRLIEAEGPMPVSDYMARCLGDPEHGYYMQADPFGRSGDFITAPEVSQLFGEILGAWVVHAWEAIGAPDRVALVEFGPGRGTLSADMLRVARLRPAFLGALTLHLVETSPRLRATQNQTLANCGAAIDWHDSTATLPDDVPLLIVANEFFDALPIRQFVRDRSAWRERCIGLDDRGALRFQAGLATLDDTDLPPHLKSAPDGAVLETQPVANAILQDLAERLARQGGTALVIDYGYAQTAVGETLQAVRNHRPVPVLGTPGEADLTAHVNFEAFARAAHCPPVSARPLMTQGDFLLRLGLLERAGQLGAGRSSGVQDGIRDDVERLAAPDQMGNLFKVMALAPAGIRLAAFDEA
ncbi:class I SAM-dependent methyltransferase [Stappia sp. ES.058]|uniref:class I SAM-dependent methyltransferase n=1 Tax=Stappia sp. ES.058 TaxID=1881061 RepID=UPI00087A208F|nr:class I SAM-dependent methyltransferase [Stappia sp. ES.058]SDU29257.1 SAM-dependent methyltransferase, MidA family [Stappia sp. ES.058]